MARILQHRANDTMSVGFIEVAQNNPQRFFFLKITLFQCTLGSPCCPTRAATLSKGIEGGRCIFVAPLRSVPDFHFDVGHAMQSIKSALTFRRIFGGKGRNLA
jgi:hypothetical protein